MRPLILIRRFVQTLSVALFVYILWSTTYPLTGIIPPSTYFRIDPLIVIFTSISERVIIGGVVAASCMIIATLIVGRFFCGWLCPLGALIDATGWISRGRRTFNDARNMRLAMPKFFILGAIAIAAAFGTQIAWIFDPIVIMARCVSINLIPALVTLVNTACIFLLQHVPLPDAAHDAYRALRATVLGINTYHFAHGTVILAFFAGILATTFMVRRAWCRFLCPLGALYAMVSRCAPLKRRVTACTHCMRCKSDCRMGAINDDMRYRQGECILCMDCIYDCPGHRTVFSFVPPVVKKSALVGNGISRKNFLLFGLATVPLLGLRTSVNRSTKQQHPVLRPPAALPEDEFLARCIRCGNCMKVCITNGLQPTLLQSGIAGIWTPQLIPEIGYCEYQCTLCGHTCPTGAIRPLSLDEKRHTRLGTAVIDRTICIAWAKHQQCLVCQEHCPVAEKAIQITHEGPDGIAKPYVIASLCVGCGICQNKCPTRPVRAIRSIPLPPTTT